MAGKAGLAIRPQDRMSRRSNPEQKRSRARQRALLNATEEILGESAPAAQDARGRTPGNPRSPPSITTFQAPRPHPHAGRAMLDELRAILAQGVVRARAGPERRSTRLCHHRRRGDFGEPPDLAAVWGAMRGAPDCAPSTRRHGGQCATSPAIGASSARRRDARPSLSSSRGFGVRFNSGASFRRKSARG